MNETRAKSLGAIKLQTAAVLEAIEQKVLELQAIEEKMKQAEEKLEGNNIPLNERVRLNIGSCIRTLLSRIKRSGE